MVLPARNCIRARRVYVFSHHLTARSEIAAMPLDDQAIEHEVPGAGLSLMSCRLKPLPCTLATPEYSAHESCLMDDHSLALTTERAVGDNLGFAHICANRFDQRVQTTKRNPTAQRESTAAASSAANRRVAGSALP